MIARAQSLSPSPIARLDLRSVRAPRLTRKCHAMHGRLFVVFADMAAISIASVRFFAGESLHGARPADDSDQATGAI